MNKKFTELRKYHKFIGMGVLVSLGISVIAFAFRSFYFIIETITYRYFDINQLARNIPDEHKIYVWFLSLFVLSYLTNILFKIGWLLTSKGFELVKASQSKTSKEVKK